MDFNLLLPLPYRVSVLWVLGIWLWGLTLQILPRHQVPVIALVQYPSRKTATEPSHALSTYRFATVLTVPLTLSLLIFWALTQGDIPSVQSWEILPNAYLILLILAFVLPLHFLPRAGRRRTLSILKRVSIGGIATTENGKFGDILMADVLTSYAKPISDLSIAVYAALVPGHHSTGKPQRTVFAILVLALPFAIRLRQCLIEYQRAQKAGESGGNHLANALKYASAFPPIVLGVLQHSSWYNPGAVGLTEAGVHTIWLFFTLLNSSYSLYWDIYKDWDLQPKSLRSRLFFAPSSYYLAILVDAVLRFTWGYQLVYDSETNLFVIELLEILRRWMWAFLRIETEWVRNENNSVYREIPLQEVH
ncbi:hypothetical protein MBLNU230_g6139t1 [Neophaeotheca triangularis]